jgi:TonB family protein
LSKIHRLSTYCLLGVLLFATSGLEAWAASKFKPPKFVRKVEPTYPKELHEAGVEGRVDAVFIVDSKGKIVESNTTRSTHPAFAEAVEQVMPLWRFTPAERNGRVVAQRVRLPVVFNLAQGDSLSRWAKRPVYRKTTQKPVPAAELEEWPEPRTWIEPYYPEAHSGSGRREEIVIGFTIDEHGEVINPEVIVGEDPHFIAAALAVTLQLEFSPHMTDDGPVPVEMAVSYQFDERKQVQWEEATKPSKKRRKKSGW